MIIILIFIVGLTLGSFINALVWRIHEQVVNKKHKSIKELSILKGRSMCVNCRHKLSALDLIPIVSWLILRGKCRYCRAQISIYYPIVEIATALLFIFSYVFWPNSIVGVQVYLFIDWLLILTTLIALFLYDLKWKILPNRIIYPLYSLALLFTSINIVYVEKHYAGDILRAILSTLIGGGLFYVIYQISEGKWIGGGDVRLGYALGLICATVTKAFLLLFLASALGCLVSLPFLLSGKLNKKSVIPFGPFLITSCMVVVIFGDRLINAYRSFVGL